MTEIFANDRKDMPVISIVTISYNSIKTISKTIESVLNQKYPKIEYIVIDGGSTDGTKELIEDYQTKFIEKGYSYKFISEKDEGISDAFNKGIELATGDLVSILNSDDWYEENTLNIIHDNYSPNYDVFCGDLNLYNKGKLVKKRKSRPNLLWLGMYVMHPTVFVKNEIYKKTKFDKNLKVAMDLDFLLRAKRQNNIKLKYIPQVITNMELGGVSSDLNKMKIEEERVLKANSSKFIFLIITLIKKIESTFVNIKRNL